jgi:putative transposase
MSNKNPPLVNGEIYHIVSRSVGDTAIFDEEKDFYRGIFCIYEFNNDKPVNIWRRRRDRVIEKKVLGPTSPTLQGRDILVEVLLFSFMPNHLHLVLRQVKDGGISKFMQKVGTGYANYFNEKYKRQGHLFNKFKAIYIKDDNQLKNVFVYAHTNLISLIEPGWKNKGIKSPGKVIQFLENCKRHSYPDYLGKKNFSSVTKRDFLLETMGGIGGCRTYVDDWVKYKKELKDWADIILE